MIRKRNIIVFLIITTLSVISLFGIDYYRQTEILYFSVESGFYENEFDLTISGPEGWDIYYTTDSSTPTPNSLKYDGAIHIGDASQNENVYSMIDDISLGYKKQEVTDIIGETPNTVWYQIPDYKVDKCTVIRAIAVGGGDSTEIITNVYFVGYGSRDAYKNISILSIVTEPDHLFGYDDGIYVLGKRWDEYKAAGEFNSWNWDWWDGNFSVRHKDSEREATIHYFDYNHNMMMHQDVGLRIQGNSSRKLAPKSLNLFAREEYGQCSFPDIFQTGSQEDEITLFAGGQDYGSKIRDALINDLIEDTAVVTRNYIPTVLFLDGEYWGLYFLTEKYNDTFISNKYGVARNNSIIFKNDILEEGLAEDKAGYRQMMAYLQNADMYLEDNYQEALRQVDIKSMSDFYAVMIYIARYNDWPKSNYQLWRSRSGTGNEYGDGRWRWMIFDLNSGSSDIRYTDEDTIQRVLDEDPIFSNFCHNSDFQTEFIESMVYLLNHSFSEDNIEERINYYRSVMGEPMILHNNRFFGADDYYVDSPYTFQGEGLTYHEKIESIRTFLINRRYTIVNLLEEHFDVFIQCEDGIFRAEVR